MGEVMKKVTEDDFNKAGKMEVEEEKKEEPSDENIEELLAEMENPVLAQKKLAIKIKKFLDKRMESEMTSERGILSENTRKWADTYNNLLEKIQKAIHGDKSVVLNLHKVSHGDIAAKIRKYGGKD
jgi:hypothetical protein